MKIFMKSAGLPMFRCFDPEGGMIIRIDLHSTSPELKIHTGLTPQAVLQSKQMFQEATVVQNCSPKELRLAIAEVAATGVNKINL